MFNKKNIAVVIAITQIVVSSFAMRQGANPSELFQNLLVTQGVVQPDIGMNWREIKNEASYQPIFDAAAHTGLVQQYKELLLTKPGMALLSRYFANPEILRMIAYMQNQFGQGKPFSYDGKGKDFFVELGTYLNPSGTTITITRYSFLKGVLDNLTSLAADQQSWSNPYFKEMYNTMVNSLSTAIARSQKEGAAYNLSSLTKQAIELIQAGNKDATMAIDAQVIKPLERIVNQYSK